MPSAEGLETQGGRADYGAQARGRQPAQLTRRTRRDCGWRHGGRAEGPTSWGLIALSCKDFRPALGYRRRTGACTPHFLSDACSDTAYRDACTIENASLECRESFIVRHSYKMSSFGSLFPFFKSAFLAEYLSFLVFLNAYSYNE